MTRGEALRLLGLEEGATPEEINTAYKEAAQIMHPDRFADNKKLAARATEQFKSINEARDLLLSGSSSNSRRVYDSYSQYDAYDDSAQGGSAAQIRAQLNAINMARTQIVAQMDAIQDGFRLSFLFIGIGFIAFILRHPVIRAFGGTIDIYGIVRLVTDYFSLKSMKETLKKFDSQKAALEAELNKL